MFGGKPNLSIGPIVPLAPDRTYRFLDYFFGADVDDEWIAELLAFDDQVGRRIASSSRTCSAASRRARSRAACSWAAASS